MIARAADLVDTSLVVRAQAGDADAVTLLAEQIRPAAQRFAGRFLHDDIRGEDVAQVAMMKAFSRLADVHTPASFPAWLMRIVRNECLNELARQKHAQVPLSVLADEGLQIQAPSGGDDDPEEALLRSQLAELVRRVAATLPPHHRQALVMRALEDRSYEEIAEAFDVPVSVVRVWYFRARQRFRKAFVAMVVARRGVPAVCQEMGESIASLIEGTLAADECASVRGHVSACSFCAQTEDELRATAFRTPARAWLIGLGLLRFGWRLPRRVAHAPAAAAKVAVAGAGSAVLATAVVGAGGAGPVVGGGVPAPGSGVVGTSVSASPGATAVRSPSAVATASPGGVVVLPTPVALPVLPVLGGAGVIGSLLQQVQNGVVKPLASPVAGAVGQIVGGVVHPPSPAPTAGGRLP
ncbi:MAG TPA: RNA polymerase sigma factor [Candidatus Dormibacteraeota bacterium]|nr:RNA polymerase sigma factor [Candidatus Dormibacteraeota bacterium]